MYFNEAGFWLGKMLVNEMCFAEFAIVIHCQNFILYSKTDLESEDNSNQGTDDWSQSVHNIYAHITQVHFSYTMYRIYIVYSSSKLRFKMTISLPPLSVESNTIINCRIAGKFGRDKVWQIDSFSAFGKRKFGKLTHQPIGY